MCNITARAKLNGQQVVDIPVINPGHYCGKTWLIEIGGNVSPLYLVVEAESVTAAIDELADDEEYGHLITVDQEDLGGYSPETCHYGPSGKIVDLDWLTIHGQEGCEQPFPCLYHSDCLPDVGIDPVDFPFWECCCDTR